VINMLTFNRGALPQYETARERLYATGFNALAVHDSKLALNAFGLMAAMSPLDERPWLGLGAAHEQAEHWELAAGFYRMGRSVADLSVWPLLGEARSLGKLGKVSEARRLLDHAEDLTSEAGILNHIERIRGAL
jgi:hypothetical protein